MSNLFRFNILRPVQQLSKESQESIGNRTHADGNASAWSIAILKLCSENDHPQLYSAVLAFLKSQDAVASYSQLGKLLQDTVTYLRFKGRNLIAKDFSSTIDRTKLQAYFKGKNSDYEKDKAAIEDTILALAIFGKLGDRGNINHLLVYKATQLLKKLHDNNNGQISQSDVAVILDKPVIVPYCRYNKCTKKYETNEPFNYLKLDRTIPQPTPVPDPQNKEECDCDCDCPDEDDCNCQNKCCAEIKPYVADLMLVREELHRYEPKHLAYIENIMLGEERVRDHRNLERTETLTETETETTKSLEKDHQVEDRFSLKSEIQKTLQENISLDAGVTVSADFGSTVLDTNFNFSYDQSRSEAQQISQDYSRNVMTRSVSKVEEKVRELLSKKTLVETEEKNSHTFKNTATGAEKHIVGQYHFVNMINRAQVMNYGKRLMFEFVLPEPMELYKELLKKDVLPFGLTKPVKPDFLADQISADPNNSFYFIKLAKDYELTGIDPMPDADIRIPFSFENAAQAEGANKIVTYTKLIATVPAGYNARQVKVEIKAFDFIGDLYTAGPLDVIGGGVDLNVEFFIDGQHSGPLSVNSPGFAHGTSTHYFSIDPDGFDATQNSELSLTVMAKSCVGFAGSGFVLCLLSDQAITKWKTSVWEKIMAKYNQDKEEYETARARYDQEKNAKLPFGNNPFINREIERTELKRLAISYISCQFYDQFRAMKRNVDPCKYPEMDLEQAQKDGTFIQFFEQLFDWNLMTYLFYPYFWSQKCSWPEKVQTNSGDPLFDKALAAGAARLQVPVRLGHEPLAVHWAAFGEIWMGQSEPPVPGTDYYVSMAQEIKEQKNCFYVDRPGTLNVTNGVSSVTLTGSDQYALFPGLIANDKDREIIIDFVVYRIVNITVAAPDWTIELDRPYEGNTDSGIRYQTGAIFVGTPFEVTVPTNLVFLRNIEDPNVPGTYVIPDCLPVYPLDKC